MSATPKKRGLIIYTGGTMGMKAQADGRLAPEKGFLTEEINKTPEMHRPEMPNFTIKEYDPLLFLHGPRGLELHS